MGADAFKAPGKGLRKGGTGMRLTDGFIYFIHHIFIGSYGLRDIIVRDRFLRTLNGIEKNGYILVHLRIIALPAQPAVFTGLQSGHGGGGSGKRCG